MQLTAPPHTHTPEAAQPREAADAPRHSRQPRSLKPRQPRQPRHRGAEAVRRRGPENRQSGAAPGAGGARGCKQGVPARAAGHAAKATKAAAPAAARRLEGREEGEVLQCGEAAKRGGARGEAPGVGAASCGGDGGGGEEVACAPALGAADAGEAVRGWLYLISDTLSPKRARASRRCHAELENLAGQTCVPNKQRCNYCWHKRFRRRHAELASNMRVHKGAAATPDTGLAKSVEKTCEPNKQRCKLPLALRVQRRLT